jgi:hypothetical protein
VSTIKRKEQWRDLQDRQLLFMSLCLFQEGLSEEKKKNIAEKMSYMEM